VATLQQAGHQAAAIYGSKSKDERERIIKDFRSGRYKVGL
jgi:superfamily II DNA/RNA helicase